MNELGQWLRQTRDNKGISLAEAEVQTRIRQKFIAALEAEEWDALPNEVTARGFLRKYAAFLGLDEEAVLKQFHERARIPAAQAIAPMPPTREADYRPIEMDLSSPSKRGSSTPWGWLAALALLAALIAGGAYLYFYQPDFVANLFSLPRALPNPGDIVALEPSATPTATVEVNRVTATPTTGPTFTSTPDAEATATPTGKSTATPTMPATVAVQPVQQMTLELTVKARAWVRLVVDDRVAQEAVMEPGQTGTWQAANSIILRTGNAAGIVATLNGQTYPLLGGPGEVVELQWRLVDGQVVQVTATPPAPPAVTTETPAATATP